MLAEIQQLGCDFMGHGSTQQYVGADVLSGLVLDMCQILTFSPFAFNGF